MKELLTPNDDQEQQKEQNFANEESLINPTETKLEEKSAMGVDTQRIVLSDEEKEMPLKALMEKYNISKATASRARKKGFIITDYKPPVKDFSKEPVKETRYKNITYLTDDERKMSDVELAKKYSIPITTAHHARQRGWIMNQGKEGGRHINIIEGGGLPPEVSAEDLQRDARIATSWAIKNLGLKSLSKDDYEDAVSQGVFAMLHETANANFKSAEWRKQIAYMNTLNSLLHTIRRKTREQPLEAGEDIEAFEPTNKERGMETIEASLLRNIYKENPAEIAIKKIDLELIKSLLPEDEFERLTEWAALGNKQVPQDVEDIIQELRRKLEINSSTE